MPPPAQGTTYTDASSIAVLLSATGLRLRLDDDPTTTGSVTGATNASPIVITSASHGVNTGDLVQLTGVAGNTQANGIWYATRIDVNTFSLDGSEGNGTYTTGGTWYCVTYPENSYMEMAANVATARVNTFCATLYDTASLAQSWSVWHWSSVIGAHWTCARRNNPVPSSINNMYLESMDYLAAVKKQELAIDDLAYRNSTQIMWSALHLDQRWSVKKLRVETVLSGRNRPQYPQKVDLGALIIGTAEPNWSGGFSG